MQPLNQFQHPSNSAENWLMLMAGRVPPSFTATPPTWTESATTPGTANISTVSPLRVKAAVADRPMARPVYPRLRKYPCVPALTLRAHRPTSRRPSSPGVAERSRSGVGLRALGERGQAPTDHVAARVHADAPLFPPLWTAKLIRSRGSFCKPSPARLYGAFRSYGIIE